MASSKKRQYADLPQHLAAFLHQYTLPGSRLLLALSGGLDSRVLLDLLVKATSSHSIQLSALHVHHGISSNADAWAAFCREVCAVHGVPLKVVKVDVPRDGGQGLEAAARQARYAALLNEEADFVVLAHHRDDQAETLMLQLLRGAGVKGLAGMGEANNRMLRPLLDVPRAELAAYAQVHQLTWIDDESNLDVAYDRNFLRHEVFPALEHRFPASRNTLARSAAHLAEAAQLLDELAGIDAATMLHGNRLDLPALRQLSAVRAKNLLRYWFSLSNIDLPSSTKLEEILRQLREVRADTQLRFNLGNLDLRCYRDQAWLVPPVITQDELLCVNWQGEERLAFGGGMLVMRLTTGAGIGLRQLSGKQLTVRTRQGAGRLRPDCARPARSLKNLLQESAVPPWERKVLPMLYCDEVLVAVPGIGVDCQWQAGVDEPGVVPVWELAIP